MSVELSTQEARLVGVYRAIARFSEKELIRPSDASLLVGYFEHLADVETLESSTANLELFLDGFVAGVAAGRLASANIDPSELATTQVGAQTGVDPLTGEVRH